MDRRTHHLMLFLRYWLPGLVCLAAVVAAIAGNFSDTSVEGAAALMGAGASIWLMNVLFRFGVDNEVDRDREEDARRFFDAHGHWPDEPSR